METLRDLVYRLKQNLLSATNENYQSSEWMSVEDIHLIRMGMYHLRSDGSKFRHLPFLDNCYEFKSIYNTFFTSFYLGDYVPEEEIDNQFDPLLISLMDHDYEVKIRKVLISETHNNVYPSLIQKIKSMEKAYEEYEYERVTTLSRTILESLFKQICDLQNIKYNQHDNYPKLYEKVRSVLKINPKMYDGLAAKHRDFSSNINQIVLKLNELRNIYSESHGTAEVDAFNYGNLKRHHIKLIVDSTKTISNFLVDSYELQHMTLDI